MYPLKCIRNDWTEEWLVKPGICCWNIYLIRHLKWLQYLFNVYNWSELRSLIWWIPSQMSDKSSAAIHPKWWMGHFRHQYRTENVKVMIHAYEPILDYICFFWFFRHTLWLGIQDCTRTGMYAKRIKSVYFLFLLRTLLSFQLKTDNLKRTFHRVVFFYLGFFAYDLR